MILKPRILTICLLIAMTVPLTAAELEPNLRTQAIEQGLQPIKTEKFDELLLVEDMKVDTPSEVYVADINLDNVEIDQPTGTRGRKARNWILTNADKEWINENFTLALKDQFNKTERVNLVQAPGENTLVVAIDITRLEPTAPKEKTRDRNAFARYFTEGVGDTTMMVTVTINEMPVMIAIDEGAAGHRWEENNRVHNTRNVRNLYKHWARNIVTQLGF